MKNTIILITLSIIVNVVEYGYGQNKCGLERFQCKSGQCIASALLCDGRPDCKDQSDETYTECSKPEITCPDYAFRCTYGGCVDGDATCNGVKDCVDNSDETLPRCTDKGYNISATCSANQFRCGNGQCIGGSNLCDGTADCADNSDETFIQCGTIACSQLFFRCNYGACIDGDLKCNGVTNCADGSDEDPRLCRAVVTEPSVITSTDFSTLTTSPWSPRPKHTCTAPPQPENGFWKLHQSQCNTGEHCNVEQGTELEPGAYLLYGCNPGYRIRGSADVVCDLAGRWLKIPVCTEIRCKGLQSASTLAECTYKGEDVSCRTSALPGTTAVVKCRNSYRPDTLIPRSRVKCNQNGQWEPEPMRCIPVCGITPPLDIRPTIVNGVRPNITEFPWHASLYKAESPEDPKVFICGATIISETLLITAAHCIYNARFHKVENPSKYYVATGNIFRDYDSPLHDPIIVKKAEVRNIYIACNYQGVHANYAEDIAILEIKRPFTLSALLLPVCLDINDRLRLESDTYGKVAGFGKTAEGSSSAILQSVTLPYVTSNQCKLAAAGFSYETQKYITHDKFCAGYTNGTSVCDGDSGGGLVFKGGDLWYLKGVVSLSLGTREIGGTTTCNSNTYSLFTLVSKHMEWIKIVIQKLEVNKSYPPCSQSS